MTIKIHNEGEKDGFCYIHTGIGFSSHSNQNFFERKKLSKDRNNQSVIPIKSFLKRIRKKQHIVLTPE